MIDFSSLGFLFMLLIGVVNSSGKSPNRLNYDRSQTLNYQHIDSYKSSDKVRLLSSNSDRDQKKKKKGLFGCCSGCKDKRDNSPRLRFVKDEDNNRSYW